MLQLPVWTLSSTILSTFMTLNIFIVGGGIGGLAAALTLSEDGHYVTVLESASILSVDSAGLGIPLNAQTILTAWGIRLDCLRLCYLDKIHIHDGKKTPFCPPAKDQIVTVHRADLHYALWNAAKKAGAKMYLNSKVYKCFFDEGKVMLQDGTEYSGDMIIAADGMKSSSRRQLLSPKIDILYDLGYTMYRTNVPMDLLKEDPELQESGILEGSNFYKSTGKCAIFYPVAGGEILNILFKCESDSSQKFYDGQVIPHDWLSTFSDCSPLLRKIITRIEATPERIQLRAWKVWMLLQPLDNWVHGKFVFIGDACHGMTSALGQGAAQALEDVAVLRAAIRKFEQASKDEVNYNRQNRLYTFLKSYVRIRKKRVNRLVVDSTACFFAMMNQTERFVPLIESIPGKNGDKEKSRFSVDLAAILSSDVMAETYYNFNAIVDAEKQFG